MTVEEAEAKYRFQSLLGIWWGMDKADLEALATGGKGFNPS